jgi:hypothetical protein
MSSIDAFLNARVAPLGVKREASDDRITTACILLAIAAIGIVVSLYVAPPVFDVSLIGL